MIKQIICTAALFATQLVYSADCSMDPRNVSMNERVTIQLSNKHWTRVSFPESALKGIEVIDKTGLLVDVEAMERFKNHLVIRSKDLNYNSKLVVFGLSGKEYLVNLITADCGDSRVSVKSKSKENKQGSFNETIKKYKYLSNYIAYEGKAPPGYKEYNFTLPMSERKVLQQGSVEFYVTTQYIGPKYIGTVFEVVNTGRASYKVSIDAIDFDNENIKKALGDIHHISMLPVDMTLKPRPSPSNTNHLNVNQHRGLVFVVTER